jgi:hypothetical protein
MAWRMVGLDNIWLTLDITNMLQNLLYEKTFNIRGIKIITEYGGHFHVVTNQLFVLIHKESR